MPKKGTTEKGDMIVNARVWIPQYSSEQLSEIKKTFDSIEWNDSEKYQNFENLFVIQNLFDISIF